VVSLELLSNKNVVPRNITCMEKKYNVKRVRILVYDVSEMHHCLATLIGWKSGASAGALTSYSSLERCSVAMYQSRKLHLACCFQ
jgi:hypothetical protein